ncbi:hypothetical protein A5724_19255 [Mycobacterium sp. ACS1612]|uniref:phage tail protein n=1 Tax=Mycobacterium sp. ACS1612 TaxID=1834117 RepID=UPI0007FE28A9|nr:phage tail protein [Mycobacterium sp. ACS1612]OBF33689.1 hypothetical protein A5724_19255 [Mycobacterium sp. ACS1612]
MTINTVPELRQPPHDPFTLLLGGRLGWPILEPTLQSAAGSLRLPRFPGSLRLLTEASGSFGGLRTPANVAVTEGGEVWLLPHGRARLHRFDPCECSFNEAPCSPHIASAAGIAAAAGHLFVCDPAQQRVLVMVVPELVLSGIWQAPMAWEPTGVAVDDSLRVHIIDPRNGMVHHFGWSGRYHGNTPGVGASRFIAIGTDGTLYAAGPMQAYRIDDGVATAATEPADDLGSAFPPAPFDVAGDGRMHLGGRCVPPTAAWYDLDGHPVAAPTPPPQHYEKSATAILGPLDSLIDECTWHRVVLIGDLPDGATIALDTHTAQVPLSAAEVIALPERAWATRLTCTAFADGQWDPLVRSPGGRYLWIRLRLTGNGSSAPRLDEALIEFPRISLRRFLPAVYGAEPTSADFTDRLLAIFDRSLRDSEAAIDDLPALLDPHATSHLDWLASWIGLRPDHCLPESLQRDIVANAGNILDLRGTVAGLHKLLLIALGLDRISCGATCGCTSCREPRQTCPPTPAEPHRYVPPPLILEHFRLRRWFEAGASTLGDRTVLWGQSIVQRSQLGTNAQIGRTALKSTQDPLRDPFHVYAHKFTVFIPARAGRTEQRRRALERLVAWGSPAHTVGQVEYVDARFQIGVQSCIGLDTVIARMPAGVTLGQTTLGPASVLDGDDRQPISGAAVGATTVLG